MIEVYKKNEQACGEFNNGEINIGETIEYSVIVFNDPEWGEAINAELSLSSNASGVNFSNNNINIGNIPPGDVGLNEESPIITDLLIIFNSP